MMSAISVKDRLKNQAIASGKTFQETLRAISKAEICKILPDVSSTTVEAVLGTMEFIISSQHFRA